MQDRGLHEELPVPQGNAGTQEDRPRNETVSVRVRGDVRGPGREMEFNVFRSSQSAFFKRVVRTKKRMVELSEVLGCYKINC